MKKDMSGITLMAIAVFINVYAVMTLTFMTIFCYQTGNPAWKLEIALLAVMSPIQIPLMAFLVYQIKEEWKELKDAKE